MIRKPLRGIVNAVTLRAINGSAEGSNSGIRTVEGVFNPQGRWIGTTRLPQGAILWIGSDLIIMSFVDAELGIETIAGHRLNRPEVEVSPPYGPAIRFNHHRRHARYPFTV